MSKGQLPSMTDETLRSYLAERKKPLLLAFWAPWCSASTVVEPLLHELAHDYGKDLTVSRMNIDENAHAPAEYGVRTIPHMVLFEDGAVVASFSGAQPKTKIVECLDTQLSRRI